jgi:phospholipid/cholesterol/gamma-HCH transport system substrate-binding protein
MSRPSPFKDEAPGGGLLATLYSRSALTAFGLAAIASIVGLLAVTIGVFTHAFSSPAHLRLELDRAGSQLSAGADVKLHGIIVGRVESIELADDSRGAVLDLAIERDQLDLIPANVTAQVIPKTLFGEKYVDLTLPVEPISARLADGATIERDRSSVAIETRTVLNNLSPLLDAVSPAELNTTLTAIATALQGRGDELGVTITAARRLTDLVRPSIPLLIEDLQLLAETNASYTEASGPLLRALEQATTTAGTVTKHRSDYAQILKASRSFASVVRGFVDKVGSDAVKVVHVSRPVLELMAKYAPEIACTVRGFTSALGRLEAVFAEGPYLKARLFVNVSRGAYRPRIDTPEDLDLSAYGPYCPVLPSGGKKTVPWPPIPRELDQIRGVGQTSLLNSINGLPGQPATGTNPLVGLLMGGTLG